MLTGLKNMRNRITIRTMKLGTKFLCALFLFAVGIGCATYSVSVMNIDKLTRQQALMYAEGVEKKFDHLKQQHVQMLSLGADSFAADREIMDIFLSHDRDSLYRRTFPFFQDIRAAYGVTHFNFISPDGLIFLRLQDPGTFDDRSSRRSFLDAVSSQKIENSLELGKNSFALRVVKPYYDNGTLIGYLELGKEIGNFLDTLKSETGDEFAIYGKKDHLNRDDFTISMEKKSLSDTWNSLPEDVLLATTTGQDTAKCLEKSSSEDLTRNDLSFKEIRAEKRTFLCAGFPVMDSQGQHIATVVTAHDITSIIATNRSAFFIELIAISAIFFLFVVVFYFLLDRLVIKPVRELASASSAVASGDLDKKITYFSADEIGALSALFNVMVKKLREMEIMKDNFISLVSHQLRTPLSSIKWLIELLLDPKTGELNEKQKKFLSTAYASSDRLTLLINDILSISQIETGKIVVTPSLTDIVSLTNEIIKELLPRYQEKSLAIITKFEDGIPAIATDPLLIRQVIMNILSNAIKYTPAGGTVRFSIRNKENGVEVEISDTGIGIPEEEQARVFERFFRASNVRGKSTEGTGLGLFIAKLIIETLGGSIGFRSELDQGTAIWFTLPAEK